VTFPVSAAEFTAASPNSLDADHLQRLLDAAYEAIILAAGPYLAVSGLDDEIDEIITPRGIGPLLRLARPAQSITSVIEGETTLAADDYDTGSSGYVLRRLDTGTNPASYWLDRIYIQYQPYSDMALREVAQIELVKLDIAFNPTLVSQTIGSWTETYQQGKSYPEQRADILASLNVGNAVGVW
jgi:hypothetical protein